MPEINYEKTYGTLNDAVYVHTLEEITWCNEKGARLLGYDDPEQLKGKNPFDFATDEHYFDLMMEAGSVGRTGEGKGGFATINRRDGRELAVLLRCTYSRDTPNSLVTVVRPILNPTPDRKTLRFMEAIRNEIKTPLAVIKGYAELMERMELDADQLAHFLSLIRENIGLLEASTEKIVAMEAIEETLVWTANAPPPQ